MPVCPRCSYDHPTEVDLAKKCFNCGWRPKHLEDAWWKEVIEGLRAEGWGGGSRSVSTGEPVDTSAYTEGIDEETMAKIKGKIGFFMLPALFGSSKKSASAPAPPPKQSPLVTQFRRELERQGDTLDAAAFWDEFRRSRPKDFDPESMKPLTADAKQIESNIQAVLTAFRAGQA